MGTPFEDALNRGEPGDIDHVKDNTKQPDAPPGWKSRPLWSWRSGHADKASHADKSSRADKSNHADKSSRADNAGKAEKISEALGNEGDILIKGSEEWEVKSLDTFIPQNSGSIFWGVARTEQQKPLCSAFSSITRINDSTFLGFPVPRNGVIKNLFVRAWSGNKAVSSHITLYKNRQATQLAFGIQGTGNISGKDIENVVEVEQGDWIKFFVSSEGQIGYTCDYYLSVCFE